MLDTLLARSAAAGHAGVARAPAAGTVIELGDGCRGWRRGGRRGPAGADRPGGGAGGAWTWPRADLSRGRGRGPRCGPFGLTLAAAKTWPRRSSQADSARPVRLTRQARSGRARGVGSAAAVETAALAAASCRSGRAVAPSGAGLCAEAGLDQAGTLRLERRCRSALDRRGRRLGRDTEVAGRSSRACCSAR